MVSQATKEYLKNMCERDMNNEEIIVKRLDTLIDLTQEMLDIMRMILENQNLALRFMRIDIEDKANA